VKMTFIKGGTRLELGGTGGTRWCSHTNPIQKGVWNKVAGNTSEQARAATYLGVVLKSLRRPTRVTTVRGRLTDTAELRIARSLARAAK